MNESINWIQLENLIQDIFRNLNEYNFNERINIENVLYLVFLIEYNYIEKYGLRITNITWNTDLEYTITNLILKIKNENKFKKLKIKQIDIGFIFSCNTIFDRNIKKCIDIKTEDQPLILKREYINKPNFSNIKTDLLTIEIIDKTLLEVIYYGLSIIKNIPQQKYPFGLNKDFCFDIDFVNFVKNNNKKYLGQVKKIPDEYRVHRRTKQEMEDDYNNDY